MKRLAPLAAFVASTLPAQVPQSSPIATETLVVCGRCVDADTGAPLPRCTVRFTGHQSTGYSMAWSRTDWADPAEVTTSADGAFRFEVRLPAADEPLDRGRYHLEISHATHASFFSDCAFVIALAQGPIDYGDVKLPVGVWPRVRCEDPKGAAQAGVLIYLRPTAVAAASAALRKVTGDGPHWWIQGNAYQRTDIDGYLHLDAPLPAGEYSLEVREREVRTVPKTITLPRAEPIVAVVAPVDAMRAITGRLVDDSGQGVEGASLSDGADGPNACRTRRDGAFTLVCTQSTGRDTADLRLAQNSRFDGWLSLGTIEWDSRNVELKLPAKSLHTFVARKARGEPVTDFNLYCVPQGAGTQEVLRLAGTFAGGRATCRLPDGDYQVLLVPRSDRILASDWQAITIDAAHDEITLDVPDAIARTVEVQFADRSAAAGVLVEAIVGGVPTPFEWVRPDTMVVSRGQGLRPMRVVASARTDAQGGVTLRFRETGELQLRVSGPGVCSLVLAADLTNDKPVPIAVERGATLLGSITATSSLRALDPDRKPDASPSIYDYHSRTAPTVTLICGDGKERREGILIDHLGRFRCDGLPPGTVEVQLKLWSKQGQRLNRIEQPMVLGTSTLNLNAPQMVEFKLPAAGESGR